jgi:hypothetical protein
MVDDPRLVASLVLNREKAVFVGRANGNEVDAAGCILLSMMGLDRGGVDNVWEVEGIGELV